MAETNTTERLSFRLISEPGQPTFPLDNPVQLIGRSSKAEISLASPDVHHKHAVVARGLGGWWVHGLNASKPLRLNEKAVQRSLLQVGDRLTIGSQVLRLECAGTDGPARPASAPPPIAPPCELEIEAPQAPPRVAVLKSDAVVGSSDRAQIRFAAPGVSTMHALLACEEGGWNLYDLKSEHGVFRNNLPISSSELADGDRIQLGSCRLIVRFASEPVDGELLARSESAAALLTNGEFRQAVEEYRRVCVSAPMHFGFRKALRAAQQQQRVSPEARIRWAGRWAAKWASRRARRAIERRKWEVALEALEGGLSQDPWNRDLLMLEALVFEKTERYEACLWCLEQARIRNPNDPHVNRPLARLQHYLGALEEAASCWRRVALGDPRDPEPERQLRSIQVERTLRHGRYVGVDSSLESTDQSGDDAP